MRHSKLGGVRKGFKAGRRSTAQSQAIVRCLRSCLENIVRNALLYGPNGTVIQIQLQCDGGFAEVSIEDDGDGVPEEALPHLFEMFYRVGALNERHPEGTGFGLAMTQRIVAMHGGTVSAANVVPHGLAVRLRLPALLS